MKNKHQNHHHISIHQRIERACHHRMVLVGILFFMALGLIKYETHIFDVIQDLYGQGFAFVSTYVHHEEITRMAVQYGSNVRSTRISGM